MNGLTLNPREEVDSIGESAQNHVGFQLKVAISRLNVGTLVAEKNTSNFLNPSRLSAYENIGERRRKQENQTQRGGKDREGFGKCATRSSLVRRWWERSSICGSKEEEQGDREGCKRVEYRTLN